jgi:hypothetical protein
VLPAVPLVVPEVPLALPLPLGELPIWAFFRTNLSLALDPVALLVDPVALVPLAVPEVPVEPPDIESPLCRHPVTVMLLLLWLELLLDVCAPTVPEHTSASAPTPPINILNFI